MEETPACRECKRTHTSMGNPVRLAVRGDREGLCPSCVQTLRRKFGPEPEPRGVESDTRALSYYIARRRERIARHQRRVNRILTT